MFTLPIYCRRDDYMFLPPTSLGGLPCAGVPAGEHFDPLPLALKLEAELPPPDLRIGMNPARGMVAVPTWFWVDGYDGGLLAQSETVLEAHENCHLVADRDASGHPVLGEDGRPSSHRDCTIETNTFTVDVRLWPGHVAWDFGDQPGRDFAHKPGRDFDCPGQGDCGDALGRPFVDAEHESPVKHQYVWSSLGVNGAQDGYAIKLDITFAADYRVTVNGASVSGWRDLPKRVLPWSAYHQVQEAQAVLTHP